MEDFEITFRVNKVSGIDPSDLLHLAEEAAKEFTENVSGMYGGHATLDEDSPCVAPVEDE